MAGIIRDFKRAAVVAPGESHGKEYCNILDREHNGYFNNVYYYDTGGVRRDIRNVVSVGSGGVIGPTPVTDNALVRWDGTTGMIVQNSVAILNDLGDLTGVRNLTATGTVILSGNTFPTTAGTNGQVLTTNGSGTLSWTSNGVGDVVGPASSTDNAVVRFDGTTGKLIQNGGILYDDNKNMTGVTSINRASGTTDYGLGASGLVLCPSSTFTSTGTATQLVYAAVHGACSVANGASNIFVGGCNTVEIDNLHSSAVVASSNVSCDSEDANDNGSNNFVAACDTVEFDMNDGGAGVTTLTRTAILSSDNSSMVAQGNGQTLNNMLVCSSYVLTDPTDNNIMTGGYAAAGPASINNRKLQLNFQTGQVLSAFVAGSYGSAGAAFQTDTAFDFAEYMENLVEGEIPNGTILTHVKRKVKPAAAGDWVIGIRSSVPCFLANDTPFQWQGRLLRDEWGAIRSHQIPDPNWVPKEGETEEDRPFITDNIENPEYDPSRPNIPRSERLAEHTPVGKRGMIPTRVDETVTDDSWVGVSASVDGLGTLSASPTRIRCLEVTTPYDIEKGYGVALCEFY
jgi:hypothetical protein